MGEIYCMPEKQNGGNHEEVPPGTVEMPLPKRGDLL